MQILNVKEWLKATQEKQFTVEMIGGDDNYTEIVTVCRIKDEVLFTIGSKNYVNGPSGKKLVTIDRFYPDLVHVGLIVDTAANCYAEKGTEKFKIPINDFPEEWVTVENELGWWKGN